MNRIVVQQLADKFIRQNNPTGWFEELYSLANGDSKQIPWADLTVNPNLADWLEKNQIEGSKNKALVVGCGLGDDAEALSQLGFEVTAFDISPTAITWCQKRFLVSTVNYIVADATNLEDSWKNSFDFILESYTLQAVPVATRKEMMKNIVQCLAREGRLLVICRGREVGEEVNSVPYPLTKEELSLFEELGLKKIGFEDYLDEEDSLVRKFRIQYRKVF